MANEMIRQPAAFTIGEAIEIDGASFQDEGSIIDVRGYGNLTLWIHGLNADGVCVCNVYMDHDATTAPADTTAMTPLAQADGTIIDWTGASNAKRAFSLGVCCNFLGVKAKYTTGATDADIYVTGTADMG